MKNKLISSWTASCCVVAAFEDGADYVDNETLVDAVEWDGPIEIQFSLWDIVIQSMVLSPGYLLFSLWDICDQSILLLNSLPQSVINRVWFFHPIILNIIFVVTSSLVLLCTTVQLLPPCESFWTYFVIVGPIVFFLVIAVLHLLLIMFLFISKQFCVIAKNKHTLKLHDYTTHWSLWARFWLVEWFSSKKKIRKIRQSI